MPQWRIQRIVIIPDGVFGVELVTVLAVDYPSPPAHLDGGQIIVGELVDKAPPAQRLLDLLVPERLCVMVPWQVDDALVRRLSKTLQRGEEIPVLGAFDGHGCPVLPLSNLAYLQEIEEIPSQDQLDGPFPASKLQEKSLDLFRRLESVATTVSTDVRIGDEDHKSIAAHLQHAPSLAQKPALWQLVPDQGNKNGRRPTLPRSLPRSTIGAGELNFSVRNGKRCIPAAVVTLSKKAASIML